MKFDGLKGKVHSFIHGQYRVDDNVNFIEELISVAPENLKHKQILRIKRLKTEIDLWKTLIFIEITDDSENEIKAGLKGALSWVASIKEKLVEPEATDLYLFLAFNLEISAEECLRIESTEQFCRKYVLLPHEDFSDFINRTFLQKLTSSKSTSESTDPLERAFSDTFAQFPWLTPEVQKKWKKAFSELSGSELFDQLLERRD